MKKLDKCPNCNANLRNYIGDGIIRKVCVNKCNGYKVIQSKGVWDDEWTEGDLIVKYNIKQMLL